MSALFAYGTLMDQVIMERVCGYRQPGLPAQLSGYGCYLIHGEQYPGIRLEEGVSTTGRLYREISSQQWQRLDQFEGDEYLRTAVKVTLADRSVVSADCYLIHPDYYHRLSNQPWDFDGFMREGKSQFLSRYGGFDR